MKVKITKCSSSMYWYSNKIGEIFEVKISPFNQFKYTLTFNNIQHYIEEKDCEIITDEIDYTIPGTPLPIIPKETPYTTLFNVSNNHSICLFTYNQIRLVSYGKTIIKNEVWIKCENPNYHLDNFYLIKLETIKQLNNNTMKKTYQITPEQAKSIIDIACNTWKRKLANKWAVHIMMNETSEVTEEFVKEMFSASNENQKILLKLIFKLDEINLNIPETINNLALFKSDGNRHDTLIAIRSECKYQNKSFYLNGDFDWKIDKDEDDLLCLIPTRLK